MKKVSEFLRDNANRYSFHFLAWIVYVFVFLSCITIACAFRSLPNAGGAGDYIAFGIVYAISAFYPSVLGLLVFIYVRLRLKERKQPNFRIKNKFLAENLFYRIFIALSTFISILFCLALLYFAILGIIANPYTLCFAVTDPFYKITICIVILYMLAFFIK